MVKFLICSLFSISLFASTCYFIPPDDYGIAKTQNIPPQVITGFVKKSKERFKPSINLATEKIDISFEEYLIAVKDMYKKEKDTFAKEIGTIQTKKGKARLFEITKKIDYLTIYQLQQILFFKNQIYILTAAFSKTDFFKEKEKIIKAFASLNIVDDLLDEISIEEKKVLDQKIKNAKNLKKLKSHFKNHYNHLGLYWKYLTLQEIQKKFKSP